jgi:hypothetical protein
VNSKCRNDAQMYFTIGTNAWSKSYNDPTTTYEDRVKIVDLGIQAIQRAVETKADFWEAMGYYNLLYREKAKLDLDPKVKEEWTKLADEWRARAIATKDKLKGLPAVPPSSPRPAS